MKKERRLSDSELDDLQQNEHALQATPKRRRLTAGEHRELSRSTAALRDRMDKERAARHRAMAAKKAEYRAARHRARARAFDRFV